MKIILNNKKAYYNYFIYDKFEAGLVLLGSEVKSIRNKNVNFSDSYIIFKKNIPLITNMMIDHYDFSNSSHEKYRNRSLLLNKKEILKIQHKQKTEKYLIIPLKLYFNKKGIIKLEIALAKSKKKQDKRNSIKEKEFKRSKQYFKNKF